MVKIDRVALMALGKYRYMCGTPVHLTSAYRTKEYNADVGGVPNSLHLSGAAFDIDVDGARMLSYAGALRRAGFNEVIPNQAKGFIHAGVQHG